MEDFPYLPRVESARLALGSISPSSSLGGEEVGFTGAPDILWMVLSW